MPKFKCRRQRVRQKREKILEQRRVCLQIRRQLKEYWPKLASTGQRRDRRQKARNKIFRPFQPLDVRDHLVRLDAQAKVRRSFLDPVLDRSFLDQLPEGEVHFHGIELRRVVTEKLFLRELGRIEVRLPARVGPSGSSGKQLRHGKLSK